MQFILISNSISDKKKAGGQANYSVLADDILPSLISKPDIWRGAQQCEHLCVTKLQDDNSKEREAKSQDMASDFFDFIIGDVMCHTLFLL